MRVVMHPEAGAALAALLPRIDTSALVRASLSGLLSGLLTAGGQQPGQQPGQRCADQSARIDTWKEGGKGRTGFRVHHNPHPSPPPGSRHTNERTVKDISGR